MGKNLTKTSFSKLEILFLIVANALLFILLIPWILGTLIFPALLGFTVYQLFKNRDIKNNGYFLKFHTLILSFLMIEYLTNALFFIIDPYNSFLICFFFCIILINFTLFNTYALVSILKLRPFWKHQDIAIKKLKINTITTLTIYSALLSSLTSLIVSLGAHC